MRAFGTETIMFEALLAMTQSYLAWWIIWPIRPQFTWWKNSVLKRRARPVISMPNCH